MFNKSVERSEWVLVVSLMLIMASLLVVSKVNVIRAAKYLSLQETNIEEILVTINGAVARPGQYKVLPGTLFEEVLMRARPKPFANLQNLALKEGIRESIELFVEELKEISVRVEGAVREPVELVLPVKSRVCDVKSKACLSEDADLSYFRRRRLLKNGEVIVVPRKRVDCNSAI